MSTGHYVERHEQSTCWKMQHSIEIIRRATTLSMAAVVGTMEPIDRGVPNRSHGTMFRTRRIADALARRSEVQEVALEPDGTTMVIREPRVRSLQVLRCLRGPTMQPIKSLFFNERSLTAMMHRDAICIADACTTVHNNNNTLLSDALWHAYGDVLPAACFNERRSERFISYGAIAIGDQHRC